MARNLERVDTGIKDGDGAPAELIPRVSGSFATIGELGPRQASYEAAKSFAQLVGGAAELERMSTGGELDDAIRAVERRRRRLAWERLPSRVVLLRHGESQGNIDHSLYSSHGDSRLELTSVGLRQAKEAGARLAKIVGGDDIYVAVSPFERTQQTLYGLYLGGFPRKQVGVVHHDPRIREQEFGNFQSPGLTAAVRAEESIVGRFYYRRPNAESSADVYDRVSAFWDAFLAEGGNSLLLGRESDYGTALLVTHGLTIRLLLMAIFHWSVDTFETVFNVGNCSHVTLRKTSNSHGYEFCPEESFPEQVPWATRSVWAQLRSLQPSEDTARKLDGLRKFRQSRGGRDLAELLGAKRRRMAPAEERSGADGEPAWVEVDKAIDELEAAALRECSQPFTVTDYLTIRPPRSMRTEEAVRRFVRGHDHHRKSPSELRKMAAEAPVDPADVVAIDWWHCGLSHQGRMLRTRMDNPNLAASSLDVTPGGREVGPFFHLRGTDGSTRWGDARPCRGASPMMGMAAPPATGDPRPAVAGGAAGPAVR